jgi:hypothetical protein
MSGSCQLQVDVFELEWGTKTKDDGTLEELACRFVVAPAENEDVVVKAIPVQWSVRGDCA